MSEPKRVLPEMRLELCGLLSSKTKHMFLALLKDQEND